MNLLLESLHSYETQTIFCNTRQHQVWLRQQQSDKISEIGVSPTGVAHDSELTGCYAVSTGKLLPTFRRIVFPHSSLSYKDFMESFRGDVVLSSSRPYGLQGHFSKSRSSFLFTVFKETFRRVAVPFFTIFKDTFRRAVVSSLRSSRALFEGS
jgi:hypothetical protein